VTTIFIAGFKKMLEEKGYSPKQAFNVDEKGPSSITH
jgi:hypothetical protein